jgi:hypothetical protein
VVSGELMAAAITLLAGGWSGAAAEASDWADDARAIPHLNKPHSLSSR